MMFGHLNDAVGNNVAGARVMVDMSAGGASHRVRSNAVGNYKIWLPSDTYTLRSHGETVADIQPTQQNFNFSTVPKTVTVSNSAGNGVSKVKLRTFSQNGSAWTYEGNESTASDGKATIYLAPGKTYALAQRIDWIPPSATTVKQLTYASQIMIGATSYALSLDAGTQLTSLDKFIYLSTQTTNAALVTGTVTDTVTSQGIPNARILVMKTGATWPNNRFIANRTVSDGSFLTVLPRTDPVDPSILLNYDVRVVEPNGASVTCNVPMAATGGVHLDVTYTLSTLACTATPVP
jgi:hypothetical protein